MENPRLVKRPSDDRIDFGAMMRELDVSNAEREMLRRERKARDAKWRREQPQREYEALPIQTGIREHNGQQISYRLKLSLVDVARRYKLTKPALLAKVRANQFPLPDFKEKGLDYWTDTTLGQHDRDH